jgi:hypothetical protein
VAAAMSQEMQSFLRCHDARLCVGHKSNTRNKLLLLAGALKHPVPAANPTFCPKRAELQPRPGENFAGAPHNFAKSSPFTQNRRARLAQKPGTLGQWQLSVSTTSMPPAGLEPATEHG